MLPTLKDSAQALARFRREARAAAAVSDDHLLAIHSFGEVNGIHLLVMPLLVGESLETRLKRQSRLPIAEAVRIARETAEGLAVVHAAGIVHRDLKPSNLWLEPSGRVKILDFGLARFHDDSPEASAAGLTAAGAILGTPGYLAPEQMGGAAEPRSDLFSLGCVLYRMTTGEPPFKGATLHQTLGLTALQQPVPPRTLNPEISPELEALILSLLAKAPADRPAAAQAVGRSLETVLGPIPVAKLVPEERPVRVRRNRLVWASVAAAVLLVVLVVVGIGRWPPGKAPVAGPPPAPGQPNVPPREKPLVYLEPMSPAALVSHPPAIKGLQSWTIEMDALRGPVQGITLNADGRLILNMQNGGRWDWDINRLESLKLRPVDGAPAPAPLALSPDRKTLAVWEGNTVKLVDPNTKKELKKTIKIGGTVQWIHWSPDGKWLIIGHYGGKTEFRDADTTELVAEYPWLAAILLGSPDRKKALVFTYPNPTVNYPIYLFTFGDKKSHRHGSYVRNVGSKTLF
jgi:serine/threonine-protein kinase